MTRARWSVTGAAVAAAVLVLWPTISSVRTVTVGAGESVTSAASTHPGAVLELAPGVHPGFTVDERVTVRAAPGARVAGEVVVTADDVRLEGLNVAGGDNGITVRGATGVVIEGAQVSGARLHGIELIRSSATVTGCSVQAMTGPYGQAIEVRNADHVPVSTIQGCTVGSGMEGIVSHVSRVVIRGNVVSGTSMRAIAVTEMSEGLVETNVIRDVTGMGVFCGDMSHCEVRANAIAGVRSDGSGVRSRSGHGIVAWYYSVLRENNNAFTAVAGAPVDLAHGAVETERFPLAVWWHGWTGVVSGAPMTAAFVVVLLALTAVAVPIVRGLQRRRPVPLQAAHRGWANAGLLIGGVYLVQSFHMVEHVAQVIQTYVASTEHRSGFLGMRVDTEWVHFVYNVAVLAFAAGVWLALRRGRLPVKADGGIAAVLLATVALQSYHLVEHAAKLYQHLTLRIDPGPGILGGRLGLVWFHFAINLAVHLGLTVVMIGTTRGMGGVRTWLGRRADLRLAAPSQA